MFQTTNQRRVVHQQKLWAKSTNKIAIFSIAMLNYLPESIYELQFVS